MNVAFAPGQRLVRGVVGRKLNKTLTTTFEASPDQSIAEAQRSGRLKVRSYVASMRDGIS